MINYISIVNYHLSIRKMVSEQKTHIKKGLIIALVLILVDIVLQVTHQKFQPWVNYLNIAILLIGVVASVNIKATEPNEKAIFSNLFGYGFKVSVVTVCVMFVYTFLSIYVVFPNYLNEFYEHQMAEAQKLPNFNAAGIAMAENKAMALKVMRTSLLSMVIMFNLAVGITGALVGSVIALLIESFNQKKVSQK